MLVAGGGIGGLAVALALAQRGVDAHLFEQASELGEIGAGVQLGPNAFAAFDSLGVGDSARSRAVYTDRPNCRSTKRFGNALAIRTRSSTERTYIFPCSREFVRRKA